MLIKFKKPDPRAGTVAQMDSSLGQQFIERGYADLHKEPAAAAPEVTAPAESAPQAAETPKAARGKK